MNEEKWLKTAISLSRKHRAEIESNVKEMTVGKLLILLWTLMCIMFEGSKKNPVLQYLFSAIKFS
jgi:hypothetical protein